MIAIECCSYIFIFSWYCCCIWLNLFPFEILLSQDLTTLFFVCFFDCTNWQIFNIISCLCSLKFLNICKNIRSQVSSYACVHIYTRPFVIPLLDCEIVLNLQNLNRKAKKDAERGSCCNMQKVSVMIITDSLQKESSLRLNWHAHLATSE